LALLGPVRVKAARRMLMKLTPEAVEVKNWLELEIKLLLMLSLFKSLMHTAKCQTCDNDHWSITTTIIRYRFQYVKLKAVSE
jgi:hypothetical protein